MSRPKANWKKKLVILAYAVTESFSRRNTVPVKSNAESWTLFADEW